MISLVGCLSWISLNIYFYKPERLEIYFLDVGQGDSQVVVFPGGDSLLIDGGGTYYSDFQMGCQVLLPFLLQKRINIKWMAISHFHPDHAKGILEIINILKPEELWISATPEQEALYKKLQKILPPAVKIIELSAPFKKTINNSLVELLHPNKMIVSKYSNNNHSQVIKISHLNNSFLFTGDIEAETEKMLVLTEYKKLSSTVLKVPHHGSKSSSTSAFLATVAPRIAIVSHGENNRFNFPHQQVLDNYRKLGTKILSTALRGGIMVRSLPGRLEVETSK